MCNPDEGPSRLQLTLPSGSAAGWSDRVKRDLDALAVACDRLLADPAIRQRLGRGPQKRSKAVYVGA